MTLIAPLDAASDLKLTGRRVARSGGAALCAVAFVAWLVWLAWRLATMHTVVGAAVLALELVAAAAACALVVGLWRAGSPADAAPRGSSRRMRTWLDEPDDERSSARQACADVANAVRRTSDAPRPEISGTDMVRTVVATEGLRRAAFVAAVVIVLLTGRVPFDLPPVWATVALGVSVIALPLGLGMLSQWHVRPGDRFFWSLATIGAGLGRSSSASVVPARWTAAMATVVVLNLAVALRGVSDRWTHGLDAMSRDARLAAMFVALVVAAGALNTLRTLPHPDVGLFGATGRLDEVTTRRWALGATGAVAVLGLVLGVSTPGAP
ncbi:MAG: hypothetical protein AAGA42_00255 [Actinomycetota bacterium]